MGPSVYSDLQERLQNLGKEDQRRVNDALNEIINSVDPMALGTPNSDVANRYAKVIDAEQILASKTSVMTFAEFRESARKKKDGSRAAAASS